MSQIVYTKGQLDGWELFAKFYMAPLETVMVLKGYSGTGKSTLVDKLIRDIPKLDEMRRLVDPDWKGYDVMVTATTHQAALSLYDATGQQYDTGTIHSVLGLRVVQEDYRKRGQTKLVAHRKDKIRNALIFIDEASYIDKELLHFVFHQTENCKIVFIGDPAQLTPVGSSYMPAFEMNQNQIELTELVRFDDGPISTMVHNLRDTVLTGNFHKIKLEPGIIEHVDHATFNNMAMEAFNDPDKWGVSKILGYYNDTVVNYNNLMAAHTLGSTELQVGQRVSANKGSMVDNVRVYNNEEVLITGIQDAERYGFKGKELTLKGKKETLWFMPNVRSDAAVAHKMGVRENDYSIMQEVLDQWVDLRHDFAKTVNKSQGSTYDTVFVNLTDIYRGARTADQLARYMYVANSRCRSRIIMTGDMG